MHGGVGRGGGLALFGGDVEGHGEVVLTGWTLARDDSHNDGHGHSDLLLC